MINLIDAIEALAERKESAMGVDAVVSSEDIIRAISIGMDLDVREVHDISYTVAHSMTLAGLFSGAGILSSVGSAWVDGILTGLLLAEMRAKEVSSE